MKSMMNAIKAIAVLLTLGLVLSTSVSAASTQNAMLNCAGTYYRNGSEGNFPPGAAIIDYSNNLFSYEDIKLSITKTADTWLVFEGSSIGESSTIPKSIWNARQNIRNWNYLLENATGRSTVTIRSLGVHVCYFGVSMLSGAKTILG
jgi:hypothetical protein